MIATRQGTFRARVFDSIVTQKDTTAPVCNERIYELIEERTPDGWEQVEPDTMITGYHYITKKDGSLNGFVIDMLSKVFGWDGDVATLQGGGDALCQVVLQNETYDGKARLKVRFVNEYDSSSTGNAPAAKEMISSLNAKYGAKLRAHLGGKQIAPRQAPVIQAPAVAPTAPATASSPASAPKSPTAPTSTSQAVWDAFCATHPDEGPERVTLWQAFVCGIAEDGNPTPEQWGVLLSNLTLDDDIPF